MKQPASFGASIVKLPNVSTPKISRLLCVVPYPTNTGFAWNYIEGLYGGIADLLATKGIRTYVAYTSIGAAPRPLLGTTAIPVTADASLESVRSVIETIRLIRALGIDAIYFTDVATWHWALPLLRLAGARWIVSHDHTSGHRDAPQGLRRAVKWIRARLPGVTADRILTVSEYVAKRQREVALAPASRVFPILNGLELPALTPDDDATPEELPSEPRELVVCACRAAPEKGVDVLLRAFDQMMAEWPSERKRPLLIYIGDGPAMPELKKILSDLRFQQDVVFLGYRTDVNRWLRRASVCVVPSRWEDACPLSVLEAMALAKPVVASTVGGVPEEINSPAVGVLVPKADEGALAIALRDLLLDDNRRAAIGRAARERIATELTREGHLKAIISHFVD